MDLQGRYPVDTFMHDVFTKNPLTYLRGISISHFGGLNVSIYPHFGGQNISISPSFSQYLGASSLLPIFLRLAPVVMAGKWTLRNTLYRRRGRAARQKKIARRTPPFSEGGNTPFSQEKTPRSLPATIIMMNSLYVNAPVCL